jgi:CYTH domain-containing protein
MLPHPKFAKIERERRFLIDRFPVGARFSSAGTARVRRIIDRYIDGTMLRLREQNEDGKPTIFKLTQKIPAPDTGAQQGYITTMNLTREEFGLPAQLPSARLTKTRHSIEPFGIDVFDGELQGLILAEAECDSAEAANAMELPPFALREVSIDPRFTGGALARLSQDQIGELLSEHGIA